MGWLRADLAARGKIFDGGDTKPRQTLARTLVHWKTDTDLADIRDEAGLAKLPEAEQEAFRSLWAEFGALRKRAEEGLNVPTPK